MAKILIVDDSKTIRTATCNLLLSLGHKVVEAASGAEAVVFFENQTDVDCAIVDFNMPGWNGIETCRRIKEIPGTEELVIFMLTTEFGGDLKKLAREVGVAAWLQKGEFDKEGLKTLLNRFVGNDKKVS